MKAILEHGMKKSMIWLPPERYVILLFRLEEDGKVLTPEEVLYKVGYYTADMCL